MADYKAPLDDMKFLLHDVFKAETIWQSLAAQSELSRELADSVLDEASKMAESLIAPINRQADEEGLTFNDGVVTTPTGFKEAYKVISENGWMALGGNPDYEGQGFPKMLTVLFEEMLQSSSNAFTLFVTLTIGATLSIDAHASDEIRQTYLPKMYSGEWTGSMCLTEPHAGTDLGMIRTKAVPNTQGSYDITGTKIFITCGEHDFTQQIAHLVLAKLPDAPAGSRGISLFIVPKYLVNADGSLGERNTLSCGSIEHKMGIHASPTCVMNFDGAEGYLIGEANKGLSYMFTMMNYERLGVGIQGLGCSERSYQSALDYARERIQGRSATGKKNPDKQADPLLVHGDIRRMLLTQKAFNEAGRAFALYVGKQLDLAKWAEGAEQSVAVDRVALLTPIAKAFITDVGLEACVLGQQVFGGHGYIREWGQEQLVRDIRIAQIYEGTNGIQAIDLLGRKVAANKGRFMQAQIDEIKTFLADHADSQNIKPYAQQLLQSLDELELLTKNILEQAAQDPDVLNASAVEYLHICGYNLYAYMWMKMLLAVEQRNDAFAQAKKHTAAFFMQRILPRTKSLLASAQMSSSSIMAMPAEMF